MQTETRPRRRAVLLQLPAWVLASLKAAVMALALAGLYLGKDVLVPFALAVLLGFVLDAPVRALRRWRVPRGLAVALVVSATVAIAAAGSFLVASQITQFGRQLPEVQQTLQKKLRTLREALVVRGPWSAASRVVDAVETEVAATQRALEGPAAAKSGQKAAPPMRVQMAVAEPTPLQALSARVMPLFGPLATAGIVIVLLIFFLLERQDLRDRLLRLVGGDLHEMTDALGEAARRVSRYLSMQVAINLGYGAALAAGLWAIGVPGALLWGGLGAVLRFVPYIGPVAASLFPLALAFGLDPGWAMLGWTLLLIVGLELVVNNLLEPWLYGSSTGVAPVALVLAVIFWTALWGPVGLILSTPLTVCLVVLGRHLPALNFLHLLLGSEPVFDAPTRLYQRLLAGNAAEATELALDEIALDGLPAFYSRVAVPALGMAVADHRRVARVRHRHRVITGTERLLKMLGDTPAPAVDGPRVLCAGLRRDADGLSAEMLAHTLRHEGVAASALPPSALEGGRVETLDLDGVRAVCLVTYENAADDAALQVCRRLKARRPDLVVELALWRASDPSALAEAARTLGVDAVAATLLEAVQRLRATLPPSLAEADGETERDAEAGPSANGAAPQADAERLALCRRMGQHRVALGARTAQRAAEIFDATQGALYWADGRVQRWQADPAAVPVAEFEALREQLVRQVIDSGESLVVPDLARDPGIDPAAADAGPARRFFAAAPLRWPGGPVVGALCIVDDRLQALDDRETRLLGRLAGDLAEQLAAAVQADAADDGTPAGPALPAGAAPA